jgi:hypothetical protein
MALEDDFARQKSAAEYIYRQLREADEANLLSEEGCLALFISVSVFHFMVNQTFLIQCVDSHHLILI